MRLLAGDLLHPWRALLDPVEVLGKAVREPAPWFTLGSVVFWAGVMGALCLPRQLELLELGLSAGGGPLAELKNQLMGPGLRRLILFDRLLPPPTLVLAAVLLAAAADPVLALSQERRRALWAVGFIGLAPMLLQRLGELAVTYWVSSVEGSVAEAMTLPRRFSTGISLFWLGEKPPAWVTSFSQRINLVALWSVGLWGLGLYQLRGRGYVAWQLSLPLAALAIATLITWWLNPTVIPLILGRP